MCERIGGNKIEACTVGDLKPGEHYRTPDGREWMVLDPESAIGDLESCGGELYAVDLSSGRVAAVPGNTKLGHDRRERLYASRYLNPDPLADEEVKLPLEVNPQRGIEDAV